MSRTVKFIIPKNFFKESKGVFTKKHIETVKAKLALTPDLGDPIPKTGGARKIWQFGINGQSRVIYYYHMGGGEIYLLSCYPKNRQKDLSEHEKGDLKKIIKLIKNQKRRSQT